MHTQGKWIVELHDAEGTYTILEAQERLGALNTDSEENYKEYHTEDLANANLIAAAPRLLEALKGQLNEMNQTIKELKEIFSVETRKIVRRLEIKVIEIESTIAKAEGVDK